MAQLKDTVVSGSLRATDSLLTTTLQTQIIKVPHTAGGTDYGTGTNKYVLLSNGSSAYWGTETAITKLDTISAGTWQGTTIDTAYGGTGNTSFTQWGVIYANPATKLVSTAEGISGYLLQGNGSAAPSWIQATDVNTASTIVKRDASGNFSAGTITAALSGNASTATILQTSRTIWGQSFNGSANISGNLTGVGDSIYGASGVTTINFLTSSSGALNAKFGYLGLAGTYADIDNTNFRLDVHGPIRCYSTTTNNRVPMNAGLTGLPSYGAAQKYGTIIYSNGISMRDPYTTSNNDCGFIRHIETTANSGYLEIGVGDDGTEPIYVRQYNTSSAVVRTLTLLDASGNTTIPSEISVGSRQTTSGPSSLTYANRITIVPYFHTGGPWYIKSGDDSTNAYLALYYGPTELMRIRHDGAQQISWNGNANSANYTSNLLGVNSSNSPYGYAEGNIIRAVWNVQGDNRWYFRAGTYQCRVDYANTASSCSGNAATATMPLGFASRSTGAGWGNTTGTSFTTWNDSTGGSIDFRQDNPSSGKMSIKVDGRFYGNEGNNPAMLMTYANSYWGMGTADGNTSDWIRTTSSGIIPYQSGNKGGGHQSLGTSTWYFSAAYIDTITSNKTYGAVWNDIAECRHTVTKEAGRVVVENESGIMELSSKRMQATGRIISDTYGYCMGEPANDGTPIAIAGRVLVYTYRKPKEYNLGDCVCAAPDGTVDIMTRKEIKEYPDRIIGIVSEIPTYEIWSGGAQNGKDDIKVNGRIWIYVR